MEFSQSHCADSAVVDVGGGIHRPQWGINQNGKFVLSPLYFAANNKSDGVLGEVFFYSGRQTVMVRKLSISKPELPSCYRLRDDDFRLGFRNRFVLVPVAL